ncbi:hypothetical protein AY599_16890 [Leptolyngbya valderiana BDU 20041]|nr:hypothetical protein AY599_16890 [Leptolyngbya valderiana BDU 20041]
MLKQLTALLLIGMMTMPSFASTDATLFLDEGSLYRTSNQSVMTLDLRTGELEIVYRNGSYVREFLTSAGTGSRQSAISESGLNFLSQYEGQLSLQDHRSKDEESISGNCSAQANAVAATAAAVEATCATGGPACSSAITAFEEAVAEYQECIRIFYAVE